VSSRFYLQHAPQYTRPNNAVICGQCLVESTPEDAIRRAAVFHPDFAVVARLMHGDGGALLATELQKASPKTTLMVLDVLPGVGVLERVGIRKPFELFVVPCPLENLRSILWQKRKRNQQ
jgi:hypothetical protein